MEKMTRGTFPHIDQYVCWLRWRLWCSSLCFEEALSGMGTFASKVLVRINLGEEPAADQDAQTASPRP